MDIVNKFYITDKHRVVSILNLMILDLEGITWLK